MILLEIVNLCHHIYYIFNYNRLSDKFKNYLYISIDLARIMKIIFIYQ